MAQLPFLIVYGAWVWKLVLVGVVAVCFAVIGWVRRWIAQNDGAFAATEHAAKVHAVVDEAAAASKLAPGAVYLAGTLRGGTITRVSQRGRWAGRQDDGLWLEHGAERIPFAGTVQLEAGSTARASWFARSSPVPAMRARLRPTLVQTVGDGDAIVVSGVVQRVAADATYREAPQRWRLVAPSGAAMRAWSMSPRVRPLPLGLWRSAAITLIAGALGWLGMVRVGAYLDDDDKGPHLGTVWSTELACALPGSRRDGLRAYGDELARNNRTDELLALYAFEGECPDDVLAHVDRFDEAIDAAKRCGRPSSVGELTAMRARHAAAAGRIDEALADATAGNDPHLAADLLAWTGRIDDAVTAALGAGDAATAVALLVRTGRFDAAAPLLETGDGSPLGTTVAIARGEWRRAAGELAKLPETQRDAIHAECLALLFQTWAGDAHAFDTPGGCAVYASLAAELANGGVATIARVHGLVEDRLVLSTGAAAVGGDPVHPWLAGPRFWLSRFAPTDEVPAQRAWVDLLRGEAAQRALETENPPGTSAYVVARIALHGGSAMQAPVGSENQLLWWRLGAGELVPTPVLCADEPGDCPFGAALHAAEHGDGGPLADAARRYGHDWTTVADEVLAVAPRVTAHRAELAAALHAVPATTSVSLFDFIETAAARRDIARLLGDAATAAQWQAVVARFDAVLADRQKAIALVLLEQP